MAQRGPKSIDDESRLAIYEGLNATQISRAYGIDPGDAKLRLSKVRPAGERNGAPLYRLKDIAPVMWTPTAEQIEEKMRTMHHSHLPKMLSKEYWSGKRSKQEYQIRAGQLWPTHRVIESVGDLLKMVRQNLTLMSDTVERQTELTDRQRQIIKDTTDSALAELRRSIIEKFSVPTDRDLHDEDDAPEDESFNLRDERSGNAQVERVNGSDESDPNEL